MNTIWTEIDGKFVTEMSTLEHSDSKGICPKCHQNGTLYADDSKYVHGHEKRDNELIAIHAKCIKCGTKIIAFND